MNSEPGVLRVFAINALDDIQGVVGAFENSDQLLEYVSEVAEDPSRTLSVLRDLGELPVLDPSGPAADGENAIRLHGYLGQLTPTEAGDERLWNYLSLITFRIYTAQRWTLAKGGWTRRFERRWFIRNATRGKLTRHSIARLWWMASLLHDADMANPLSSASGDEWAYLRSAFAKQDFLFQFSDREIGAKRNVMLAVLDHIEGNPDRQREKYTRDLAKHLTLVAGYREISFLSAKQTRDLVDEIGLRISPNA